MIYLSLLAQVVALHIKSTLQFAGKEDSRIATVVIRGSMANIMDDVERAVDDAVNTYKTLTRDARFVPGAGATEIELAKQLTTYGEVCAVIGKDRSKVTRCRLLFLPFLLCTYMLHVAHENTNHISALEAS